MNKISISPGKNNVGAYINNLDLKYLKLDQKDQIKDTLNKYGVIFIKKQSLNPENYQNFAKSIGELVEYPRLKGLNNYPYINVLERKPTDKSLAFGGSWLHQDTSYLEKDRPRYTMLLGIEIPVGPGNTIFSSGFNAYKKLPDDIQQKITCGLTARHAREAHVKAHGENVKLSRFAYHPAVDNDYHPTMSGWVERAAKKCGRFINNHVIEGEYKITDIFETLNFLCYC